MAASGECLNVLPNVLNAVFVSHSCAAMLADMATAFGIVHITACQNVLHGLISASPITFTSSGMVSYVCSICASWPIVSGSTGFSVLSEKL